MRRAFLGLAIIGTFAISATAGAFNILINPGFESGLVGWTTTGFVASGSDFHSGAASAFARGNFSIRQDFAATPTGLINEVSWWSKQPNLSGSFFFAYDFFYSDSSTEQLVEGGSGPTAWTQHNFTSQLDPGKNLIAIQAWGYSSGNPEADFTFHDDFVVNVVPEPATLLLTAAGFALMLRRKWPRN